MSTTIAQTSIELVSKLIRNEFDNNTQPWQIEEAKEMIKVAKDFGLNELAEGMINDLK